MCAFGIGREVKTAANFGILLQKGKITYDVDCDHLYI